MASFLTMKMWQLVEVALEGTLGLCSISRKTSASKSLIKVNRLWTNHPSSKTQLAEIYQQIGLKLIILTILVQTRVT